MGFTNLNLYPFQIEGKNFLKSTKRAVLGDEMGLGKTPQAVVAAAELGAQKTLTLCPKIVKPAWARQMGAWGLLSNEEDVFIVETGTDVIPSHAKHIICNYDLATIAPKIAAQLLERRYDILHLDEIQRLKSPTSARAKFVLGGKTPLAARAEHVYGLSGTIMPNRPIEMFLCLFTLAHPSVLFPYNSYVEFGKHFCSGFLEDNNRSWNFKGASNLDELRERIKPFFLRRTMAEVLPDLPPVISSDLFFDIGDIASADEWGNLIAADESNTHVATLRRLIGENKVEAICNYITDYKFGEQGIEKLVVFAYHKSVIDKAVNCLFSMRGKKPLTIDGRVSTNERQYNIDQFINGPIDILFCQHQAAGEAVDGLQFVCNDMLDIEPDWSPGAEDQIVGRLKRIGQRFPIRFERCLADASFDGAIIGTQENKRRAINTLLKPKEKENIDMSIETSLERIATALEKMVGQGVVTHAPTTGQVSQTPAEKPATNSKKNQDKPAAATTPSTSATSNVPQAAANSAGAAATTNPPANGSVKFDDVREQALIVLNELYGGGSDEGKAAISNLAVKPFNLNALVELDGKPELIAAAYANLQKHIVEKRAGVVAPKADALAGI